MIDPIHHKPVQPPQLGQVDGPQGKPPVERKPFVTHPAEVAKIESQLRTNFEAIRLRICHGLDHGLNKQQILTEVSRHELITAFGPKRVPESMVSAVVEAVQSNPKLSQTFDQLYRLAASARRPPAG